MERIKQTKPKPALRKITFVELDTPFAPNSKQPKHPSVKRGLELSKQNSSARLLQRNTPAMDAPERNCRVSILERLSAGTVPTLSVSPAVRYQLDRTPFGTSGRLLRRTPVASKTALPMAGATAMMGVSPAPAEGRSFRSIRIASISGTSRKRGTR
jgi:hypothetical protein